MATRAAAAHVYFVKIHLQYFIFLVQGLHDKRHGEFERFSAQGAVGSQEVVLYELLGDRRTALDNSACSKIGDRRPKHPEKIDPAVFKEPVVLDRHNGVNQVLRNLPDINKHPAFPLGPIQARYFHRFQL